MENDSLFSTRDLYLAAVLITLKFPLQGTDFSIEGEKSLPVGYFKFLNTSSLQEAKQKYQQGLISVEPRLFITNMRSLKAEIANIFRNPHLNSGLNKE